MKTVQLALVLILSLFIVTACSKKADDAVTIAPAAEVAGVYRATAVEAEGRTSLIASNHQISYTLIKTGDTQVRVLENQTLGGTLILDEDYGTVELRRSGRLILFYDGALQLGHYDNGMLSISFLEADGNGRKVNKTYTAKRQ